MRFIARKKQGKKSEKEQELKIQNNLLLIHYATYRTLYASITHKNNRKNAIHKINTNLKST